jgi:hypothetical protein
VTDFSDFGWGSRLTFHGPLSAERADRIAAELTALDPETVVFGSISEALTALRGLVNPGGRVLFGAEIWDRTPTGQQLSAMWPGTTHSTCLYLADVVDAAVGAGFRPLRIETATLGEWDEFESGLAAGAEEWLLANPEHPEARQVRDRLGSHLSIWLRGHRDVMGFAYLTLAAPL